MKRVNIKYLVVSLILVLSLLLGTSCSFSCSFPSIDTSSPSNPPATHTATPIDPDWSPPSVESNATALPNFVPVVAKVRPSVVAIKTDLGAGSGWIIREDGIIVTNNHVVEGARQITVTLGDGRTFPVETVCRDPLTDLAIVKIDAQDLPAASIGDSSQLKVGEPVVAIGNSLGLGISIKGGWVSRLEVSIPLSSGLMLYDLVETDAAINPGNSGGPLVNMSGQVIGITSAKVVMTGVEGMGWAISINSAMPIINQLVWYGYVSRPYLGITYCNITPTLVWWYDLAVTKGVLVAEVIPNYPADEAGLKPKDVIVGFDSKEITNAEDLRQAISSCEIGQKVKITYWRGNTKHTTHATLIESPPPT